MTDLDLDRIDRAFAEFVATAAPRVVAPGAAAVVTTHRHRRRMGAVGAGAVALALAASTAGYAVWHGHHNTAGPTPVDSPTPTPSVPYIEQPPDLRAADCTSSTLPMSASGLAGFDFVEQVVADPTGRYVLASLAGHHGEGRVVRWHDGAPELLPIPFAHPAIVGVTSDGTVVGGGRDFAEQPGWVYRDGKLTMLASNGDEIASPLAVNGAGDIVGYLYGGYTVTIPALWPAGQPDVVRPFEDVPNGAATGIDAAGDVVGIGGLNSYVWDSDGTRWSVTSPSRPQGGGGPAIAGHWIAGAVVGRPARADLVSYAAIWNRTSGSIVVLPYANSSFNRVASDGTATGSFIWAGAERAVRYRDGAFALLPPVQTGSGPSGSDTAGAITTDGHTIFGAADSKVVAVWHC